MVATRGARASSAKTTLSLGAVAPMRLLKSKGDGKDEDTVGALTGYCRSPDGVDREEFPEASRGILSAELNRQVVSVCGTTWQKRLVSLTAMDLCFGRTGSPQLLDRIPLVDITQVRQTQDSLRVKPLQFSSFNSTANSSLQFSVLLPATCNWIVAHQGRVLKLRHGVDGRSTPKATEQTKLKIR